MLTNLVPKICQGKDGANIGLGGLVGKAPLEEHTYCKGGICTNCKMREREREEAPLNGQTYQEKFLCPLILGSGPA